MYREKQSTSTHNSVHLYKADGTVICRKHGTAYTSADLIKYNMAIGMIAGNLSCENCQKILNKKKKKLRPL